jgi:hypothetical protein
MDTAKKHNSDFTRREFENGKTTDVCEECEKEKYDLFREIFMEDKNLEKPMYHKRPLSWLLERKKKTIRLYIKPMRMVRKNRFTRKKNLRYITHYVGLQNGGIMNKTISEYFAKIGSKGGKKSKRAITPKQQAKMQSARKKEMRHKAD